MRLLMTPPHWSEIDAALQLISSSKNHPARFAKLSQPAAAGFIFLQMLAS